MHECQPSHARCVAREALTRHGEVIIRCHDKCLSSCFFPLSLGRLHRAAHSFSLASEASVR
jgi:hypothetical protein